MSTYVLIYHKTFFIKLRLFLASGKKRARGQVTMTEIIGKSAFVRHLVLKIVENVCFFGTIIHAIEYRLYDKSRSYLSISIFTE